MNFQKILLPFLSFIILAALAYYSSISSGFPTGGDADAYMAEMQIALEKNSPTSQSTSREFPYFIEKGIPTPPFHNSIYHTLVFPFAKILGIAEGFLCFSILCVFISTFFIALTFKEISGLKKLNITLCATFLVLCPFFFYQAITIMQEPMYLALSSVIVYLFFKIYGENNDKKLFYRNFLYAFSILCISAQPIYIMVLGFLLFVDLLYKRQIVYVFSWGILALIFYYICGKLFPSTVSATLFDNIWRGTEGPYTLAAHFCNYYEPTGVADWILRRFNKAFSPIMDLSLTSLNFIIGILLFSTVCFFGFYFRKKDIKASMEFLKISILFIVFSIPFLVQIFLAEYHARHFVFIYPVVCVGVFYTVFAFWKKYEGHVKIPLSPLVYACLLLFIFADALIARRLYTVNSHDAKAPELIKKIEALNATGKIAVLTYFQFGNRGTYWNYQLRKEKYMMFRYQVPPKINLHFLELYKPGVFVLSKDVSEGYEKLLEEYPVNTITHDGREIFLIYLDKSLYVPTK